MCVDKLRHHVLTTIAWIGVFVLSFLVVGIAIYFKDQLSQFRALGLFGIFLANLLGSAIPFVPIPGITTVIAGGILYSPVLVALLATVGAIIGDVFCYFIGLSGERLFIKEEHGYYKHLVLHMKKYGWLVIFIFAFVPNPVFDVVGVVAGLLNYSVKKFLLWLFIGRLGRNLLLAFFGAGILT